MHEASVDNEPDEDMAPRLSSFINPSTSTSQAASLKILGLIEHALPLSDQSSQLQAVEQHRSVGVNFGGCPGRRGTSVTTVPV